MEHAYISNPERTIGRVKWYDFDKAMGFIQELHLSTGNPINDVFVHKSSLRPVVAHHSCSKLITGEIVEFEKRPPQDGKKQDQAFNVTGLFSGPLMCDFGQIEMTNYTYIHSKNKRKNDETDETGEPDEPDETEQLGG